MIDITHRIGVCCLACIAAFPAIADDSLDLGRVTVTATRESILSIETPASIHTLTSEQLRIERQVRSMPESLGAIPGVLVQRTGHGQGSPYIRGFTGFRTLFLIDGIRLNNSTFRDGPNQYWNTVDPFSVGKLELVKGPISVLYGSDAIGGTVNAMSPFASDLTDGPVAGALLYRYASAENSHVARIEAARVFDGTVGLRGGATLKDFGNLVSASGTQARTGYPERDVDAALTIDADHGLLTLAYQRVAIDDAWRTHRTVFGQPYAGTTTGNEQRRSLNQRRELSYLRYLHDEIGPLHHVSATLSHQRQDEDRLRVRADGRSDHQGTFVDTVGLALAAGVDAGGRWQLGVEHYRDSVDSFRTDFNADGSVRGQRIQGPVGDDASYDTTGIYLQNRIATGPVNWVLGARYNHAEARADKVQDPVSGQTISVADSWNALVGSVRGVYHRPDANWSLFGGVSQGFRAPNLSDLTRFDSARSNELEVPSTGLKPEDFVNYEIGLRFEQTRFEGQFAVFHTDIDKLITRTPTGDVLDGDNVVTRINSADGDIDGFEAEASYRLDGGWAVFGTLGWIDGEVLTFPDTSAVGIVEPLDRLMPLTVTAGLRWDSPQGRYWARLDVMHADDADKLSSRDAGDSQRIPPGGTPGYTSVDVRGGFRLPAGLEVSAAIENISDELYRTHGSGVNEAGRSVVVTLNWHPR